MRNNRSTAAWNSVTVAALTVASALVAGASAFGGSIVGYTDGGSPGNHTGSDDPLNIGREFTVSASPGVPGIEVTSLGAYADNASGNPISFLTSHTVSLFSIGATGVSNPTNTLIASVTVPAGTVAPFEDGFRFASLSSPVFLAPGNYAVITYGLNNGNEAYGDGGAANNTLNFHNAGFDPYQFTSNASPAFPTGGDGNNHNGASLIFSPTPEPCSFILCGLGAVGLFVAARRRRKA